MPLQPSKLQLNNDSDSRAQTVSITSTGNEPKNYIFAEGKEIMIRLFFMLSSAEYDNAALSSPTLTIQPRAHELEPLDVATHLHLLGESLSVIGTRLKEQNVREMNFFCNNVSLSFFPSQRVDLVSFLLDRDKLPFLEAYQFCSTRCCALLDLCSA